VIYLSMDRLPRGTRHRMTSAPGGPTRLTAEPVGEEVPRVGLSSEQVRQCMRTRRLPEDIPDRLFGSLSDFAKQSVSSSTITEQLPNVHRALMHPSFQTFHCSFHLRVTKGNRPISNIVPREIFATGVERTCSPAQHQKGI